MALNYNVYLLSDRNESQPCDNSMSAVILTASWRFHRALSDTMNIDQSSQKHLPFVSINLR